MITNCHVIDESENQYGNSQANKSKESKTSDYLLNKYIDHSLQNFYRPTV
jgi:hypothetical protein